MYNEEDHGLNFIVVLLSVLFTVLIANNLIANVSGVILILFSIFISSEIVKISSSKKEFNIILFFITSLGLIYLQNILSGYVLQENILIWKIYGAFACFALSILITYNLAIIQFIDKNDWEATRKKAVAYGFVKLMGSKDQTDIDMEIKRNRMNARIKINEKVFGRFAWDNF
jgi:hypothetical protein